MQPLDEDNVLAVTLGTVAWLVAFAVLYVFFRDQLRADGQQWWLTVCLVGAGLGVAGRQVQEFQRIGVLENSRRRLAVDFSHRW